MYILLVFNDQDCEKLNCMWMYTTIKELIDDTKNVIKYSDVNKKTRIYKTAKSFFKSIKNIKLRHQIILQIIKIMSYSICRTKYLFLENAQRNLSVWDNLPTLSQSSRECYISVASAKLVFSDIPLFYAMRVKIDLPVMNYTSSSNSIPVIAMLSQGTNNITSEGTTEIKVFELIHADQIQLFSNDNLKRAKFVLEDEDGVEIVLDADDRLDIMLKIDYVDQLAVTNQYISEVPMRL